MVGAKLQRRFGNCLLVPVAVNNKHGMLLLDTGAPITVIDKNSVATYGLSVEKTNANVGGMLGTSWERYGISKVKSIAMGNCTVTNVPVGIIDLSGSNENFMYIRLEHINGVLGTHEMRKFGMIIDCTRQMLYLNPNGASAGLSQSLASFLTSKGFTRIPLHVTSGGHLEVEGSLNSNPTRFIVDTGSPTTTIDDRIALKSNISYNPMPHFRSGGVEGSSQMMHSADVKELAIGSFVIPKAEVEVLHLSSSVIGNESTAGFFGAEYLSFNFGVIDVGGQALYLRHPDPRK